MSGSIAHVCCHVTTHTRPFGSVLDASASEATTTSSDNTYRHVYQLTVHLHNVFMTSYKYANIACTFLGSTVRLHTCLAHKRSVNPYVCV